MKHWSIFRSFCNWSVTLVSDQYNIYIISGQCLRVEGNKTVSTNQHNRCTSFSLSDKVSSSYFYWTEKGGRKCLFWKKKFWVKSCEGIFGRLNIKFLDNLGARDDKGTFVFEIKDDKENQEIVTYLKSEYSYFFFH